MLSARTASDVTCCHKSCQGPSLQNGASVVQESVLDKVLKQPRFYILLLSGRSVKNSVKTISFPKLATRKNLIDTRVQLGIVKEQKL